MEELEQQVAPWEERPFQEHPCPCLAEEPPYQAEAYQAEALPYQAEVLPFPLVLGTQAEHPCLAGPFLEADPFLADSFLAGPYPFLAVVRLPLEQEGAAALVAE